MSSTPTYIGSYRDEVTTFANGQGTKPLAIFAGGASGSRIHAITLSSTDSAGHNVALSLGKRLTDGANMGIGAITATTITRTTGSFLTDGYKVGDRLIIKDPTTPGNQLVAIVTATAAMTLTFAAATFPTAENLPTTASIYRLASIGTKNVPANSGALYNYGCVPALDTSINGSLDPVPSRFLTVGSTSVLFATMDAAITAAKVLEVLVQAGDY